MAVENLRLSAMHEVPRRRSRSVLAVPATSTELFAKAAAGNADYVFLDLEDAVAVERKAEARRNAIAAVSEIDWQDKTLAIRINAPDTKFMYRDIVDILELSGGRLDLLLVPKVEQAGEVIAVDLMVTQIEAMMGRKKRIGLDIIIETAAGMADIHRIARASRRVEALHFGVGDYSLSLKANGTRIGGPNPSYAVLAREEGATARHWGDMWHYATSRLLVAARANNLRAIDGPFADFGNAPGYDALARSAATLGFDGKWAIHPNQLPLANIAFTPDVHETERAREILRLMDEARHVGKAAIGDDGKLLDLASIKQAEMVLARAALFDR